MPNITRRQFWRIDAREALRKVTGGRAADKDNGPKPIRPPGAKSGESAFLDTCERCGGCASACPHDAIDLLGPQWGRAEGSPAMEPETAACHWCSSWDCIAACPTGGLDLPKNGTPAPVAMAVLEIDACMVSQGTLCDECAVRCPSDIRAITIRSRFPVLDEAKCTGCGLCSVYCPAEPRAIRIVPLPDSPNG